MQCKHELLPTECAICLGRWDHDVRSLVTGKVRTSREYIPWFVPSTLDRGAAQVHPVQARDRKVPSDGAAPSSSIEAAPAGAGAAAAGGAADAAGIAITFAMTAAAATTSIESPFAGSATTAISDPLHLARDRGWA